MDVFDRLVVATDSEEVAAVCAAAGAEVEMTRSTHPSGTDRIAEVAEREAYREFDIIVNVQGDEPLVAESHVRAAFDLVGKDGWDVGTCASPITDARTLQEPSVVKVVRGGGGRALYFSRAAVPFARDGIIEDSPWESGLFLRHIGVYAYTQSSLREWVALRPSPLEQLERLEQLRPLEAGVGIGVALVEDAGPGVDTPEDVVRMEKRLKALQVSAPAG